MGFNENDEKYMRLCLDLARQAEGRTAPNPMVGAIVVDAGGKVAGRGLHKKAGTAHAESEALDQAGALAQGGTLYVNLEPCCHFGKTPPCSTKVIDSQVKRVVIGISDPNPVVCGNGIKALMEANIEVSLGLLEKECTWLNRGFLRRIKSGLPWICLKVAATLDGRIADRLGQSKWISGEPSRKKVHELRNSFDSVLVGTNTVKIDDPELTVRTVPGGRNPIRIALDARLEIDPNSRFCQTKTGNKTIIYTTSEAVSSKGRIFTGEITFSIADSNPDGTLNLEQILKSICEEHKINTVLLEGGSRLSAALLEQGFVNELFWVVTPKLLIDQKARSALAGNSPVALDQIVCLKDTDILKVGDDIWIHATL